MTVVTWLAILVLGPGSLAVFWFFLRDLKTVMGERRDNDERDSRTEPRVR
jgi:hypothetical protein